MSVEDREFLKVQNIVRRSQALILNVKLLGADTSRAKELLDNARSALEKNDLNSAIEYAKQSMVEVMELKKQVKSGAKPTAPMPPRVEPAGAEPEPEIEAEATPVETPPPTPPPTPADSTNGPTEPETAPEDEASEDKYIDQFEVGFGHLIEETRANKCFTIFSNLCKSEKPGLCICRVNPAIIRRRIEPGENIKILWLTDRESNKEPTISPALESMIYVVEEFIDQNQEGIILLDGLEYLISNNNFNPVLRFLRRLVDRISETSSILLIGVSPKAIQELELKLLERELTPIFIS